MVNLLPNQRAVYTLAQADKLPNALLLWWGMGSGKTLGGLLCTSTPGAYARVLVLCDKSLVGQWKSVVAWFKGSLYCEVKNIDVLHYQTLTTSGVKPAQYDVTVVDESHRFRNAFTRNGPAEYAAWIRNIMRCKRLVYLTGTPIVSDAVIEMAALRAMLRVGPSSGFAPNQIFHYDPKQDVRKRTCFAIVNAETVHVPATLAQLLVYFSNQRGRFAITVGDVKYEVVRPVRNTYNSALIAAANTPFPQQRQHCPKLVAIISNMKMWYATPGSKQLVYSSRLDSGINALRDMWLAEVGDSNRIHTIDGSQDADRRFRTIRAFNRTGPSQVLFISDAAGQGVDLKSVNVVHLLEPGERLQEERQVINRAVRYKSHKAKDAVVHVFLYCLTFGGAELAAGPLSMAADALGMFDESGVAFEKKLGAALVAMARREKSTIDERIMENREHVDQSVQACLATLRAHAKNPEHNPSRLSIDESLATARGLDEVLAARGRRV